jgi:hypothetical protein
LLANREEMRIGLINEKGRVITFLKSIQEKCEAVKERKSNNMIVLFKYEAQNKGGYALQSIKAVEMVENENLDFAQWISLSSLEEV